MTTAKPLRPDIEILRLAAETADDVLASPAARGRFFVTVKVTVGETTATFDEPPKRELRDLLVALRTFDMPSSDIRLRHLYEIVERAGVLQEWRPLLGDAKADFERHQKPLPVPQVPDFDRTRDGEEPPLFTPRQAWELWLDAEVIHRDYTKELRWNRLEPPWQGSLRMLAHDYGSMLLRQAKFMRDLIRSGMVTPA
jgi:hypothetical protein